MIIERVEYSDFNQFSSSFFSIISDFTNNYESIDKIATKCFAKLFNKYELLNANYIGEWEEDLPHSMIVASNAKIVESYWYNKIPELLAMTNNLAELSVIPINDSTVKDFEQNADTFSMSENQPIDATENVTTPYIKVKGKAGYTNKETVTHNTVKEALERVAISKETEMSLTNFIEAGIRTVIREYNTAY